MLGTSHASRTEDVVREVNYLSAEGTTVFVYLERLL